MFATMFFRHVFNHTPPPPVKKLRLAVEKKIAFFIAVQFVYQFICSFSQNSKCKSFFFPYVLGNITKNESKLFYTITKYIQLKNK